MANFIYEFNGVWLGGFMFISAKNRVDADKLFKKGLPKYLHEKNFHSNGRMIRDNVTIVEIPKGTHHHLIWNGDY